jgi:ATP-binding cassette subfamily B protein
MAALVSTKKTYIDPADLPEVDGGTLRRILAYLRPYRPQALLVMVCLAGSAALGLVPPLLVKAVVDGALPARDLRLLMMLCLGMLAVPLLAGLVSVAQKRLTTFLGERVTMDLRLQVFEHVHRQSLRYFVSTPPGEILSSVLNDVQGAGAAVSSTVVGVAEDLLVFTSTGILLFVLDWRLALLSLGLLPFFVVPTRRVGQKRKRLRRAAQARVAELTGILAETLSVSGAHLVKIFGAERFEAQRLRTKSEECADLALEQAVLGRWFQMLMGLFETAGPALVFGLGGWLVIRGEVALGTVVAFVTVLKRLYGPASGLAGVHVDLVTSYAYFERVFRVLDREPEVRDAPRASRPSAIEGAIRFRRVSLALDGEPVLRDIDLTIAPGQDVAVVGPSGAGKTSLIGLVPRLFDPSQGAVLLDGRDLRDLQLAFLRRQIGVVTQDTYLFHASALENLRYARPAATRAEIEEAARKAQIHDFIASLPRGYETVVGERGYRLSCGERQRLALARAILKDARILLLDEPTSSLDPANEAFVQSALEPFLAGRTSLVVSHRLSAVRWADLIVVLDRGRICERGTHGELMARGGLYAALYHEQARHAPAWSPLAPASALSGMRRA